MTQLYSKLAAVYHEIYQQIFDYEKEYNFYDSILERNNCRSLLELGSGSGMLARKFLQKGYDYLGVDLSDEMLEIARTEIKADPFRQGDMRNLSFDRQFDAVIITGRSISYVIDNKGLNDTFTGVHKSLKKRGLFIFGVFEANGIFDNFLDFEQTFELDHKTIRRISKLKKNLSTGWTYDWYAKYIIEENGRISEFDDLTTLRSFTKDEVLLFLKLNSFNVIEIMEEAKTMTFVCEKDEIK